MALQACRRTERAAGAHFGSNRSHFPLVLTFFPGSGKQITDPFRYQATFSFSDGSHKALEARLVEDFGKN